MGYLVPPPSRPKGWTPEQDRCLASVRSVLDAGGEAVGGLRLGRWWIDHLSPMTVADDLETLTVYGVPVEIHEDPYGIDPLPS